MEITRNASDLSWVTNTKGKWSTLIKDLQGGALVFSEGYTPTVTGKKVTITSASSPVGLVTYTIEDDNVVSAGALYGAGSVSDSLEAIAGDKTVRMGSVDLGTLTWTWVNSGTYGYWRCDDLTSLIKRPASSADVPNAVADNYVAASTDYFNGSSNRLGIYCVSASNGRIIVRNGSSTVAPTGYFYYELATPTTSTETPQSLSLTTGDDTLSGGSFDTTYEGTDYSIPLIRNCKYLHRSPDGTESLVTGSTTNTSIDVKGGESKLVNLTHWFGRNREPSIEDFYKLYPTWKTYDIPYDQGSVLNYKGTGVETIGFNAYDHSTGTAFLLGGNKYQICGVFTSVSYVDVFGNTETLSLDSANCFTPVNDGTLTVTGGNGTDTCVHLVWSGYKNYGEPEYKWEPFTRNVKELPISTYFPEGMNGIVDVRDELTSEQFIQRIGVVDLGDLTYNNDYVNPDSSHPNGYVLTKLNTRKTSPGNNLTSTRYPYLSGSFTDDKTLITSNTNLYIVDSSFIGMTGVQIKAALSGVMCYYELATPVVTQIDQPLNLAYPVNDFGTEHSLPQNTTTLVTTDLKALIKYNTDYMRMNSQLSGIFPTVKSLARQEQDGHIMKKDDTAPNATVGNAFNLIDRNAEGTERQFSFDTSGGTQDITDGTAVAKKSMGTTLNLNQLVHDTNQNTVTGNGQVEVEDAVAGDVTSLVVEGRSLVRNQLVPPSLDETEDSSNGMIEVTDAVAGDAKGLVMTAPRSVVVNQFINSKNYTNKTEWVYNLERASVVVNNGVVTFTKIAETQSAFLWEAAAQRHAKIPAGHKILPIVLGLNIQSLDTSLVKFSLLKSNGNSNDVTINSVSTFFEDIYGGGIWISGSAPVNSYVTFTGLMLVDLTQYFNGDQTLIDSITSWDDLVAYDPRFASYVEYNTGEVAGVQPTVKATGKNLCNPSIFTANGGVLQSDGSYYFDVPSSMQGQRMLANKTRKSGQVAVSGQYKYESTNTFSGIIFFCYYTDGTHESVWPQLSEMGAYHTVNFVSNASKTVNYIFCTYGSGQTKTWLKDIQIEWSSSATTYEPYHSAGVAASPVPLYGVGTAADSYDAVTGKVGHQMTSVDLSTLGWTWQSTDSRWYTVDIKNLVNPPANQSKAFNGISEKYPIATFNAATQGALCMATSGNLFFYTSDSSSSGKPTGMLYYELATPTEETLTSSTISLQQGNNVAIQTDGGRTAPFSLTYDGTEFTLPLDSTHKYAFSDNGTKSIVTGATEQAVTGGQDMLVDVTRMFNGDATAINAVTSWDDMAVVMPEYLSNVAYNDGEVVGRSGGVTTAKWNQLVQNGNFSDGTTGWGGNRVTVTASNNVGTFTVYGTSGSMNFYKYVTIPTEHVVLFSLEALSSVNGRLSISVINTANLQLVTKVLNLTANTWTTTSHMGTLTSAGARLAGYLNSGDFTADNYVSIRNVQLFDLTEIYGAGHEPSTVEEFEADCAKWGKNLTQYQAYDAGTLMGGSATFSDLHGVGSVVETQDVVSGRKDVKFGSVDLGSLTWTYESIYQRFYSSDIASDVKHPTTWSANVVCADYVSAFGVDNHTEVDKVVSIYSNGNIYIRNKDYAVASAFKAAMSGVILYYELATPTTSSLTPQPITFINGLNNVYEENTDITGTPITMEYTGTDYAIAAKTSRVYLRDVNGTVERVTGVSSFSVRGGRDNIMDLTRMFGAGLEPGTLADFYNLFPAWNGYRLPYNKGSLLNFKGTGLKSVGFNLLDLAGRTLGEPQNTAIAPTTVRGPFDETKYYVGFSYNNYYAPQYVSSYSVTSSSVQCRATNSGFGLMFPVRCIPGQTYRYENFVTGCRTSFYTYNGSIISYAESQTVTAPENAYWMLVGVQCPNINTTYTWTNPCVHLQWSGTRNGDYEPYWDYVRPIPTLTYFPDGMNGRGQVYDEINPRQAIKRFGKVDLGTLTWTASGNGTWTTTLSGMKSSSPVIIPSEGYDISVSGTTLTVTSDSEPVGDMVYELATPVVTSFPEEISATARISDYGTEECLPVNGYDPVTTPFRGMVLYQEDYARTITKLPENYISKESLENLLSLLNNLHNGNISMTYNQSTGEYNFSFTPNV